MKTTCQPPQHRCWQLTGGEFRNFIRGWIRIRALDEEVAGQEVDESRPHPGRHLVGGGRPEVYV